MLVGAAAAQCAAMNTHAEGWLPDDDSIDLDKYLDIPSGGGQSAQWLEALSAALRAEQK